MQETNSAELAFLKAEHINALLRHRINRASKLIAYLQCQIYSAVRHTNSRPLQRFMYTAIALRPVGLSDNAGRIESGSHDGKEMVLYEVDPWANCFGVTPTIRLKRLLRWL